jgi:hypothetical protein
VGPCEHGNEPSGFIKVGINLTILDTVISSRWTLFHAVSNKPSIVKANGHFM